MYTRSLALLLLLALASAVAADGPKHVLLLGQTRDHPAGSHEYMPGMRVLDAALKNVPGLEVKVSQADEPWPVGPAILDEADAAVLYVGEAAKWAAADPARKAAVERLAARGGGIVALHWGIGSKDPQYLDAWRPLVGGLHGGPDRKYIVFTGDVRIIDRDHPIMRGVKEPGQLHDEFYYRLKFARADEGKLTPILQVAIDGRPETVAWAFERAAGGRSFGFSAMHFHTDWQREELRRMIVQALLWTLDLPVPESGVPVDVPAEAYRLP